MDNSQILFFLLLNIILILILIFFVYSLFSSINRSTSFKNSKYLFLLVICSIIILITSLFYYHITVSFFPKLDENQVRVPLSANEFGDSFGALNTVFAGLAFVGLFISILMQNRALEIAREEMKLNRSTQKMSESAIQDQIYTNQINQRIDFFKKYLDEKLDKTETNLGRYHQKMASGIVKYEIEKLLKLSEYSFLHNENLIFSLDGLTENLQICNNNSYLTFLIMEQNSDITLRSAINEDIVLKSHLASEIPFFYILNCGDEFGFYSWIQKIGIDKVGGCLKITVNEICEEYE